MTPFGLRMPQELKNWVQEQAEQTERSMNWVIVKLLQQAKEAKGANK